MKTGTWLRFFSFTDRRSTDIDVNVESTHEQWCENDDTTQLNDDIQKCDKNICLSRWSNEFRGTLTIRRFPFSGRSDVNLKEIGLESWHPLHHTKHHHYALCRHNCSSWGNVTWTNTTTYYASEQTCVARFQREWWLVFEQKGTEKCHVPCGLFGLMNDDALVLLNFGRYHNADCLTDR